MKQQHLPRALSAIALISALALLTSPFLPVQAADLGPRNAGAASSIAHSSSSPTWSAPENITAPGPEYASVTLYGDQISEYLMATSYGFNIPPGSRIDGIQVMITRRAEGISVKDYSVRLVKGGMILPVDRADMLINWPTILTTKSYGGATDLWGTTWTAEDINADNFGVVLAARYNDINWMTRTLFVDTIQVTVFYTTIPAATTMVDCGSGTAVTTYGSSLTCVATVSGAGDDPTPSGLVNWVTDGSGTFTTNSCSLLGSGGSATCSVTYTPDAVGDGLHLITGTYSGDTIYNASSGSQDVTVEKATPTLTLTNSPETYNGDPLAAVLEGSVPGDASNIRYNGDATVPVNAGTYAVTADFVPTESGNYASLTGAPAGSFMIAPRPITVTANAQTKIYGETDPALTYQVTGGEVVGSDAFTGVLSREAGEDVGTYAIGQGSLALTANYNLTFVGAALTITQATPTLSITNSPVIYDGLPNAPFLASSVDGMFSNVRFNGEPTLPVNAGTYAVTADFTPEDANYSILTGVSIGDFVINPRAITVTADDKTKVYGEPDPLLTFEITSGSLVVNDTITGTLRRDEGENAGIYAILQGSLAVSGNYDLTYVGADLTITRATPTLSISNSPVTYNGAAQEAAIAGSVDGVLDTVRYGGSATLPVNAGTYNVTANFTPDDEINYESLTAAPAGTFVIQQATPALSVTNSPVVYDGEARAAMVSGSVDGVVGDVLYDGNPAVPVNAGTYTITASFIPDSPNYASLTGAAAGNFVIDPRPITITAVDQTRIYGEIDPALSYTVSEGALAEGDAFSGSLSRVPGEDVGTYAIEQGTLSLTDNYILTFDDGDAVLTITVRPITVTAEAKDKVYGEVDPAFTYQITAGTLVFEDDFTGALAREAGEDAGTYAILQGSLALSDNYVMTFEGAQLAIHKATPTLSITNSPVTYTGGEHAAAVQGSVAGVVSNILYGGKASLPVNAGTYAVTADFTPTDTRNYESLEGAAAGNFVIQKATPSLSINNSPVFYNGSAQAAIIVSSVAGAVSNVLYDGVVTVPVDPGVYAVRADFDPTDATNYTSLSGASAGDFIILAAGPALDLKKTAAEASFSQVGEVIHYSYKLTNTGNVVLAGPFTVSDDQVSVTCPQASSLAAGASLTCTASDTVTAEDIQAGVVTNKATGYGSFDGEEVASNSVEVTVTYKPAGVYIPLIFGAGPAE